ncbi:amidase family protein [Streptomyces sp. NPDC059894]|uniref:amidase family protein n=1 Tax=unclassified Streptomyces TaxID=2593676 RepID=UPI003663D0D9
MDDGTQLQFDADEQLERARTDRLNSYIALAPEAGTPAGSPSGALYGVGFACKDNIDTEQLPTSGGTSALAASVPLRDHPAVARLREAGAVLIGKTNLHELALGATSDNATFGPVRNPLDRERLAGGSSGGSASAVRAGSVPFALATDTGGSARVPAAWCAVAGFRPTVGRWGTGHTVPLSWSRDSVGVIAADVDWVIAVDGVVTGENPLPGLPGPIRLGVPAEYTANLDESVDTAWAAAVSALEQAGVELYPVELGRLLGANEYGLDLVLYEVRRALPRYLAGLREPVSVETLIEGVQSPDVEGLLRRAFEDPVSDERYGECAAARDTARAAHSTLLREHGLLGFTYPTTPLEPLPVGSDSAAFFAEITRNTEFSGFCGLPAVSVALPQPRHGFAGGLSIEGTRGDDRLLLAVAKEIEHTLTRPGRRVFGRIPDQPGHPRDAA